VRYNRFLVRLLLKHPDNVCLSVLNGHACVASGTYKYALGKDGKSQLSHIVQYFIYLFNVTILFRRVYVGV
jgi:hypothetical protein